uniref:Uncharacterized protein n=1 Tax=Arundo donax TaxID=35708 RepID=A0A0A9AC41_ARUDO
MVMHGSEFAFCYSGSYRCSIHICHTIFSPCSVTVVLEH